MTVHHLAQLNIARMHEPLDSERMAGFVAALEPVNALADASPGFVWRLATEDGDATSIRVFDDDMLIVNLSVWESLEALEAFVYKGGHLDVFRRRAEWFEPMAENHVVLWWVPVGTEPAVEAAAARLEQLRRRGPTPGAFTIARNFPPPRSQADLRRLN